MHQLTFATPDFDASMVDLSDIRIIDGYSQEANTTHFMNKACFDRNYNTSAEPRATRRGITSMIV